MAKMEHVKTTGTTNILRTSVVFALCLSLPAIARHHQKAERGDPTPVMPAKAPAGGERYIYKEVGDTALPLYVYRPEGRTATGTSPAMVFFFGGAWKGGNPAQFEHHCKYLAERGVVAITVEYRVSSRHQASVADCVEDAKSAMRWVRGNAGKLGIDPDRIAAGGGSAGGHLAACTALIQDWNAASDNEQVSPKPNAMVLFNPWMGEAEPDDPQRRPESRPDNSLKPLTYASLKQPPCIMFFGTADGLLEGAERFRELSEQAGNQCKIVTYEGQGHGFFNHHRNQGKYYHLTVAEMDAFLVDLGWLPAK